MFGGSDKRNKVSEKEVARQIRFRRRFESARRSARLWL